MTGKEARANTKSMITSEELVDAQKYFSANNLLLNPPLKRAAYSDRTAWVMASMAQLVYMRFEERGKDADLLVEKLKGGGFKLLSEFNSPETDTQAFLVSNGVYAVLAFRFGVFTAGDHAFFQNMLHQRA